MEEHSKVMAKYTKDPRNITVRTSNQMSRGKAFYGNIKSIKSHADKSKILKGKKPGTGLGDYTLDLMKLS